MIGYCAFSDRKVILLCPLVPLLLLGLAIAPAAAATDSDAVTYQNNPAHDGSVTFSNFSTTPTKLWSVNLGHQISYPLIAQGEVYATVGDNTAASGGWTVGHSFGDNAEPLFGGSRAVRRRARRLRRDHRLDATRKATKRGVAPLTIGRRG